MSCREFQRSVQLRKVAVGRPNEGSILPIITEALGQDMFEGWESTENHWLLYYLETVFTLHQRTQKLQGRHSPFLSFQPCMLLRSAGRTHSTFSNYSNYCFTGHTDHCFVCSSDHKHGDVSFPFRGQPVGAGSHSFLVVQHLCKDQARWMNASTQAETR